MSQRFNKTCQFFIVFLLYVSFLYFLYINLININVTAVNNVEPLMSWISLSSVTAIIKKKNLYMENIEEKKENEKQNRVKAHNTRLQYGKIVFDMKMSINFPFLTTWIFCRIYFYFLFLFLFFFFEV